MKLVIDLRLINTSGIGTYLKNVIPGILSSFDQIVVLGNTQEIMSFDWSKEVQIIECNAKIYSFKEQLLYPIVIPKCDVFWSPHFNLPILPIKAKKIVATIHDVNHLTSIAPHSFLKKKYAFLLFHNAVSKANLIFTVSEFSKREILKYTSVNAEKIKVVYCGVDESFFQNTQNKKDLKLPENYILYVGNVKPHKNLIVLLKAYNSLSNQLKSKFKLVIIGKKEGFITQDKQIEDYIIKNNLQKHIVFTGYVHDIDLPKIYQNASLFVFPSLYEGFGLPVLEAMAARIKVLSSNAASLPEIGGDAVIYFDPLNDKELASKIASIIENPIIWNEFIKKTEFQLAKFTWSKSIQNHLNAFKTL